jgi:3-methylcrotonyl-CoA carboxylase alpha subunit
VSTGATASARVFRKLLIANRGEIACRIARSAQRLGVRVVAVYSDADAGARHTRLADEAWPLGPAPARQSYLNVERVLETARLAQAEAIHPGYGFLSENAEFAAACARAGLAFVGPPAQAIAAMGDKAAAKGRMQIAGIPVLPGYQGAAQEPAVLEREAAQIGLPLIIKPSAGGGGKGMQIVREPGELGGAIAAARRIAASAFGNERLLLERYLPNARHVEVQVLADRAGQVLHLLDRDCSVQRRHQKLIEEAPAPGLSEALRVRLAQAACAVAREIGYVSAGTVEFMVEGEAFYFLEMNTRLQVEHPVTEAITGLDLVEWQLRIAAGEPLSLAQSELRAAGHAIEARVCAEDPAQDFRPGAGRLRFAHWPAGPCLRVDTGFEEGDSVPSHYDSLLAKVIAHGRTRTEALERLQRALADTHIVGVPTNTPWLAAALDTAAFRAGGVDTQFASRFAPAIVDESRRGALATLAAAARVFSLLARRESSPWSWGDNFRIGADVGIPVRLRAGERIWRSLVLVEDAQRNRVRVRPVEPEGPEVCIVLEPHREARLLTLRPLSGGAPALAWVEAERIHIWQEASELEVESEWTEAAERAAHRPAGSLSTTLPGTVVSVQVKPGDRVAAGQPLLVIEAMKMEHTLRAPRDGTVKTVKVRVGDRVDESSALLELEGA